MPDFFASKADFDRAVQEALAPIKQELERVTANREVIINEKRALEGKTVGRTAEGIIRTADALHIPRELVSDHAAYQKYRKIAQDDGLEIKILEQPVVKDDRAMPDKFTTDRMHYVSNNYLNRNGALYREEKAFAERLGLTMKVVHSASELPLNAFIPQGDA